MAGFNLSDVEPYADLVRIADPDFIEVKGVTYCGTSNNAELRFLIFLTVLIGRKKNESLEI